MIDWQSLQAIFAVAAGLTGVATTAFGYAKRKRLFAPRQTLLADLRNTQDQLIGERRRAETAEAANSNQSDSIEALRTSVASLRSSVTDLQTKLEQHQAKVLPMQQKIDALTDWAKLLVEHNYYLKDLLHRAGVEPEQFMPPVPSILADRFDIPETLRDA